MQVNGVELEKLDIFDADIAEKYEKALDKVLANEKNTKGLKLSSVIRKQCNSVFEFFNTVCGEGTAKKVFGDKVNLITCIRSFEEVVEQCNEQKKEIEELASKYSPNRAQRRTKK